MLCSVAVSRDRGNLQTGLDGYVPWTAHGFEGLECEKQGISFHYLASWTGWLFGPESLLEVWKLETFMVLK